MAECIYCGKALANSHTTCLICSFPVQGTDEEKYKFLYLKSIPLQAEMSNVEDGLKKSRTSFYVAAGVAFLSAILAAAGAVQVSKPGLTLAIVMLTAALGIIFIVLGIFLKKSPLIISIIGFALALLFLHGGILGIVIILLLAYGTWCAVKYNSAKRKFDTLSHKMSQYEK